MDKSLASADGYSVPAFGAGSVLIYANSLRGGVAVGFLASPQSAQEPEHLRGGVRGGGSGAPGGWHPPGGHGGGLMSPKMLEVSHRCALSWRIHLGRRRYALPRWPNRSQARARCWSRCTMPR